MPIRAVQDAVGPDLAGSAYGARRCRLNRVNEIRFEAIASDGCRLRGRQTGREGAPWLLLAHPIGFDARFWDPLVERLASDFALLVPDARGHGGSARGPGEPGIDQLADDLRAILDARGIATATLVGCSLGSSTAMRFAVAHAGRAAGLVLANAPARIALPRERFDRIIAAARSGGFPSIARDMLARWVAPGAAAAAPDWYAAREAEMLQTCGEGFADAFAALRDSDRSDDLARIALPALVVTGEHDRAFDPAAAEAMARGMRAGEAAVISGCGHLAPLERPQEFAALVRDFHRGRLT